MRKLTEKNVTQMYEAITSYIFEILDHVIVKSFSTTDGDSHVLGGRRCAMPSSFDFAF